MLQGNNKQAGGGGVQALLLSLNWLQPPPLCVPTVRVHRDNGYLISLSSSFFYLCSRYLHIWLEGGASSDYSKKAWVLFYRCPIKEDLH
jgi:hypothetical protein